MKRADAPFPFEVGQLQLDSIPRRSFISFPAKRGRGTTRSVVEGASGAANAPTTAFQAVPLPRSASLRRGGERSQWQ